ncbi:hypothetical protein GCM10009798_09720 [Nocardioides panacihumi]|uniref:Uncharacterized protein n=1 Tax=Nocardioides panacihumi TaxID=400774 RepID=A0ABN2QHJ9_9ACTN
MAGVRHEVDAVDRLHLAEAHMEALHVHDRPGDLLAHCPILPAAPLLAPGSHGPMSPGEVGYPA